MEGQIEVACIVIGNNWPMARSAGPIHLEYSHCSRCMFIPSTVGSQASGLPGRKANLSCLVLCTGICTRFVEPVNLCSGEQDVKMIALGLEGTGGGCGSLAC